jgi:hypothetical protein
VGGRGEATCRRAASDDGAAEDAARRARRLTSRGRALASADGPGKDAWDERRVEKQIRQDKIDGSRELNGTKGMVEE